MDARRLFLALATLILLTEAFDVLGLEAATPRLALLALASVLAFFALGAAKPPTAPSKPRETWLLDTSALVDGRVLVLIERGLAEARLVLAEEVLAELQSLADRSDRRRRARGRRGLDNAAALRGLRPGLNSDALGGDGDVDDRLLTAAAAGSGRIVSADAALLRRAEAQGLPILDLHALARDLRVAAAPGDRFELELVRAGRSKGQAVGYQEDGCMVVVDNAREAIGTRGEVEVLSCLTTRNGPLIFARLIGEAGEGGEKDNGAKDGG